ncbi:MAG TPA: L,D-transpeptidase [Ktedonobacteraceae bacterium]
MRDTSRLPISVPAGLRHAGIYVATLLCYLLLLSACNGDTGSNAARLNALMLHRRVTLDATMRESGQLQIQTFQQWIGLMQQFNGSVGTYGQELLSDKHALDTAKNIADYQNALQRLRRHTTAIQIPALKNEANYQQRQLAQEATAWGKAHTYHDSYNGVTYRMGYEYSDDGMVGLVQDELSSAKTLADYQQAIQDATVSLINFQAYRANTSDSTSWDQAHQTDMQLMQEYHTLGQRTVVISLSEETMRLYDQDKLVKAFHVTTGRPEKPSLPGFWVVESKQSPTVFKSDQPKGSPYWYPDTPIHYAMLYHSGGYFLHDSWWRSDYGPNTQFPHYDSSGDSFSFDGSHGCVNIATGNAAWVYSFVDVNTPVIVY